MDGSEMQACALDEEIKLAARVRKTDHHGSGQ